jgi:hypothetical protein
MFYTSIHFNKVYINPQSRKKEGVQEAGVQVTYKHPVKLNFSSTMDHF